jgi:hypothetical protein
MDNKLKNAPQELKSALKRHTSKWIIPGEILGAVALLLGYCQTLERPFLDRFDEYDYA